MARRKSNIIFMNEDLYYYSSEDSEDELDRLALRTGLNAIQSNFNHNLDNSPIFNKSKIINESPKQQHSLTQQKTLKKSKSDIRQVKLFKHKPNISNILNFFTYGYDRDKHLNLKEEKDFPKINKNSKLRKKIDWKVFYELLFVKDKINKNNYHDDTYTNISELINNKIINDENINKFDEKFEEYKFKIILDKIKYRMKKKYELNNERDKHKYKDISIGIKNKKIPEMILNLKKDNNDLKNIYKVGISDIDKHRFLPMLINKLKKRFNIYIDKNKYEKRQYFQSLRKNSFNNKSDSPKKKKKIKFDANKKIKIKYSITEEKLPNILQSNMNNIREKDKRKNSSKNNKFSPSPNRKSLIKNDSYIFKHRKTLSFKRSKENNIIDMKYKTENNLSTIYFYENELNSINNKKIYMTDDKLELFKNNAKIIINDEVLFNEIKREYPDYEDELFNLYNNFLLYKKIYDKLELKNYTNMKKNIDYNHNINNFLSLNTKINIPINDKFEINNKILDNAINLQKIINYFK